MHEASLVEGLISLATSHLPPGGKVLRLSVVAEAMAGVERECLATWFQELSQGTPLEGADLTVEVRPSILVCRTCGHQAEQPAGSPLPAGCPSCGGSIRLNGGTSVYLDSMEVEET